MNAKTSAHYQREYRRRLRDLGLVKKEVWIRPEHASSLAEVERRLRDAGANPIGSGENRENTNYWTTLSLYEALRADPLVAGARASLKLIDGVEPSLQLEMHEYGDLPLFVAAFGDQVIVEAVLWPYADVEDTAAFNDAVLRTHKFFPLSTVSLDTLPDGQGYYQMFGALGAGSRLAMVVHEIDTLARNVIQVTEAFEPYLRARSSERPDATTTNGDRK